MTNIPDVSWKMFLEDVSGAEEFTKKSIAQSDI